MPATAQMNAAMQEFTETGYKTSEQHKEEGNARSKKDETDVTEFINFLQIHNPFNETSTSLRHIETGVTANGRVNCDNAKEIGNNILKDMVGKDFEGYSFKKSKQAVTMNEKSSIKVLGEPVVIDPQLLFQRLITAARFVDGDVSSAFQYELIIF
jgi:hypothetical protein